MWSVKRETTIKPGEVNVICSCWGSRRSLRIHYTRGWSATTRINFQMPASLIATYLMPRTTHPRIGEMDPRTSTANLAFGEASTSTWEWGNPIDKAPQTNPDSWPRSEPALELHSRAMSSVGLTSPFQRSQHRKQFWRKAVNNKKEWLTPAMVAERFKLLWQT